MNGDRAVNAVATSPARRPNGRAPDQVHERNGRRAGDQRREAQQLRRVPDLVVAHEARTRERRMISACGIRPTRTSGESTPPSP